MKKLSLLLLAFMFLFIECKKGTETLNHSLPPPTQTGSNTFGCLVNGAIFYPQEPQSNVRNPTALLASPLIAFYGIDSGRYKLYIQAIDYVNNPQAVFKFTYSGDALKSHVTVPLADMVINSVLPLNQTIAYCHYFTEKNTVPQESTIDTFRMVPPAGGTMVVSFFDSTRHIISGTFSFNAADSKGTNIQVTEGRFDLSYINEAPPIEF